MTEKHFPKVFHTTHAVEILCCSRRTKHFSASLPHGTREAHHELRTLSITRAEPRCGQQAREDGTRPFRAAYIAENAMWECVSSKLGKTTMADSPTRSLAAQHETVCSPPAALLHSKRNPKRVLVLIAVVVWACSAATRVGSTDEQAGLKLAYPLVPQWGTFGPHERPALWQLPEGGGPVERVLVIYTPKDGTPGSFWDYSPSCPTCTGLPERRNIVEDALSRKYAVFVPDALKPDWEWWPEDNPDVLLTQSMITEWKDRLGLEGVPTMALGISSGGYILSTVALRPGFFDAICLMISHGVRQAIESSTYQYPPTIFIHMARDLNIGGEVRIAKKRLDSRGVPTQKLKWYPHPLTPDWLSKSIIGVDLAFSTAIFNCVKREGWLDKENFFSSDEYHWTWDEVIPQWNILPEGLPGQLLSLAIKYELDVAYAQHVAISRRDDKMFAFFEENFQSRSPAISSF